MKPAIDAMDVPSESGGALPGTPDPAPNETLGPWVARALGDHFDLSHFGVSMEILEPGSKSAMRHWHTKSDEFIMLLEGALVLVINDGETSMTPGMVAGFRAGEENGHHLINRTSEPARFLVVGSRIRGDRVHYPDDDFQWLSDDDGTWYAARKDGTKY